MVTPMTYIQATEGTRTLDRAGISMHIGRKRERQEDCAEITDRYVIVADGMGGQKDGDKASRSAVLAAATYLNNAPEDTPQAIIEAAFEAAQSVVCSLGQGASIWTAPATTMMIGIRTEDGMTIGHLGDSRVYAYVGGLLVQITNDHENPDGTINAYVGLGNYRQPDIRPISGDDARIIFATDGLFGMLNHYAMTHICNENAHSSAVDLATRLTEAAVEAGGFDNVTVAVVDL